MPVIALYRAVTVECDGYGYQQGAYRFHQPDVGLVSGDGHETPDMHKGPDCGDERIGSLDQEENAIKPVDGDGGHVR